MRTLRTFLLLLLTAYLPVVQAQLIEIQGHLDADATASVKEQLAKADATERLVLRLNAQSGELDAVLDLAEALFEWRESRGGSLVFYLEDSVLGPPALLPFVADELHSSVFVSWGDIPLGTGGEVPTNVLRSRVVSLVSGNITLRLLAEAMADPSRELYLTNAGLTRVGDGSQLVSAEGEALVVNQNQLRQLGLLRSSLGVDAFLAREGLESVPEQQAEEVEVAEGFDAHLKWMADEPNRIGHIAINDSSGISNATFIYVNAALDYYKANKPRFIILELNTPGGEVFASQRISDALKEMDTVHGVPIVAHVNNWAISAGAMLAYSCRYIVVAKDAAMGAAEPVIMGGGEVKSASEKMNSALRADFANRAGFYERNEDIAEAMVDKDIILVKRFGKITRLDDESQIRKTGPNRDEIIAAKGKLLTLKASDLVELGVADALVEPAVIEPLTEQERTTGRFEAAKYPLFSHPYFKQIPNAMVDAYRMDWRLQILAFLNTPAIASFLFLGMMLGFYVEINSPGFGLPGTLGVVCLGLIFVSSMAADAASLIELFMIVGGLILLGIELFVLPGFGIAGLAGVLLLIGGLVAIMLPGLENVAYEIDGEQLNAAGQEIMLRLGWLSAAFVLGVLLIVFLARNVMPKFGRMTHLISVGEQESSQGYSSGPAIESLPEVGAKGRVTAMLRPAGKIEVDGKLYDALSDGDLVDEGTQVRVTEIRARRLIVVPLKEA